MYAVIVNGKFLGKEKKITEAFTVFLEILKGP